MSMSTRQAVAETHLLDVEVLLQHLELLLQRHLLDVRRVQRHAQQVAEPVHHPVGGVDVGPHQAGDGVQGVEEEVRMQLSLQRLQLRLDQPHLELRRIDARARSDSRRNSSACARPTRNR